jgi:hypothetical protein
MWPLSNGRPAGSISLARLKAASSAQGQDVVNAIRQGDKMISVTITES